ncbi:NAD-dependent epimerase/dehydratase family protein [Desulfocicer niacini]
MKNILITGGTGFIGRYLVKELSDKGYRCRCLVRRNSDISTLKSFTNDFFYGDITDGNSLKGITNNIDTVFHLAGSGHVSAVSDDAYKKFIHINVQGTINLIQDALENNVDKFIHFSSTAAMGLIKNIPIVDEKTPCRPSTPYQNSKYEAEQIVLKYSNENGLKGIVLRPCLVYGPGGKGEFLKICRLMKKGFFPKVGTGKNLTPLVHVRDVVQGAIKSGVGGIGNNVYLLTSAQSIEMDTFRNLILSSLEIKRPYIYIPKTFAKYIALFFEITATITKTTPFVTYKNIDSTITDRVFSIQKAFKDFNYQPKIKFNDGISETIKWYLEKKVI